MDRCLCPSRLKTWTLAAVSLVALLGVSGCETSAHHAAVSADLSDVIFSESVNDEALQLVLGVQATDGKGQGAVLDMPADGTVISAATPLTFSWHAGPTASVGPSLLRRIWDMMGIAEAYAHGDAVNGKAYFLVISSPNNPKLVRVFTGVPAFAPDAVVWAKLTAAAGPLTARVTTALFDTGKITPDGGPFLGKVATFTVQK